MKFNGEYIAEGMAEIIQQFETDYEKASIELDVEGSTFNNPDILDLMDFLSDTGSKQATDKMVRQCILGKTVLFTLDGESIGSVRMNTVTDSWATFPVFNDHPAAYKALADTVSVHLLKKSTLPRKKGTAAPGAVAPVEAQR